MNSIKDVKPGFRVAVATKEGTSVSLHFGHAKQFQIYFFSSSSGYSYEGVRVVDQYCHEPNSGSSTLQTIIESLHDCDFVLCARIGDGPAEKLEARGIKSNSEYAYEGIEEALSRLAASVHPTRDEPTK